MPRPAASRAKKLPRPPRNDPPGRLATLHEIARLHGGRCFARTYPGNQGRATFQCRHGHRWETTPAIIFGDHWCPQCRYRSPDKLVKIQEIARERGGECLSREYPRFGDKLRFRCERGHEWEAEARKIREGHWCGRCPRLTLADMDALVADRGGRCVAPIFPGGDEPIEWECAQGHRFHVRPRCIRLGQWCPECRKEDTWLGKVREIAARRGGALLSVRNLWSHNKLRWRCARGHEWRSTPGNILNDRWCPRCADTRLGIELMQQTARERGGECISRRYVNRKTKLQWECEYGHRWWATPDNIRHRGSWCPECAYQAMRARMRAHGKDRR